jgi:hypothetical protein
MLNYDDGGLQASLAIHISHKDAIIVLLVCLICVLNENIVVWDLGIYTCKCRTRGGVVHVCVLYG